MRQITNGWVNAYLTFTEKQESPQAFHKWCAISVIAAAMERNCWIDYGYFQLYPNQYIILIGASASVRKSSAILIADNLFKDTFPKAWIFSQKVTAVSLIAFLRDSYKERGTSGGYIVADELSVFLGNAIQDATLIQLLTKIYTCPKAMDYSTMARGRELANNTFCNMLGGTTPEWIKDSFPPHAIGGGFAGRILFIYQATTDRRFLHAPLDEYRKSLRLKLINDLKEINSLKGEFALSEDGRKSYDTWYMEIYNPDPEKTSTELKGYFGRKHDFVLKLAMALSASRGNSKIIERDDIGDSLALLGEVEIMLPETMSLIQTSIAGQTHKKVLMAIASTDKHKMRRPELIRKMSYLLTSREVDDVLNTLMQGNQLSQDIDDKGIVYKIYVKQ